LLVEIIEERGKTTFCDHVALCAGKIPLECALRTTHLKKCGERVVAERLWEACTERLSGPRVVTQSEIATDDMFEESDRLRLDELIDHVAKDGADGEKALIGVTDVREPGLVEKDLLYDENCHRLGEL
jgi:hypothetical protein